jgi:hypothetical protein
VIAQLLRLGGEVIGIDADAVAADQAGIEAQEIPLGAGRRQDFAGADADEIADLEISFIRAMLMSRWVFSITLAASATLIDDALWMPASTTAP